MKMTHMKRSAAEKKERDKMHSGPYTGDDYPYGLGVTLDHESMQKLGMDTLPTVGSKLMLHAHAHVKSASEESRDGGKKTRRVELELRHMNVEGGGKTPKKDMSEEDMRKGAKSIMDKALSGGKVGKKDLGSESAGDAENG